MTSVRSISRVCWVVALALGLSACMRPDQELATAPQIAATEAAAQTAPASLPTPPPAEPGVRAEAVAEPPPAGDSAAEAARAFYRMHLQLRASGLPVGEDLARYRPMLSKRLLALMGPAARERDRMIAQEPDLKPPFIEGDLFTSLFEGASEFELGQRKALGPDRETMEIEFSYTEGGQTSRWKDRVTMLREDGRWKLDDVEYGGSWDFATRGRLSDSLKQID
ncbi:hypothetical protein [Pseudomonas sp. CGJS7]|uniref:hypothetical protein n=1 Tax=Pseudomonas sp. CGJS7 TaxID=3109348 RepID=UPI0030083F31